MQGLLERGGLGRRAHDGGVRRETLGLLEGETPVDALAAVGERLLQLTDQSLHHFGIVGQPGGTRQLRGVEVGIAGEKIAQHVAEVILGRLVPRIISHAI